MSFRPALVAATLLSALLLPGLSPAADPRTVAVVKIVSGGVSVERAGQTLPVVVGMSLHQADTLVTGRDGSAGVTFEDNSLMSLGASTRLAIDRFQFDRTTHAGRFETTLGKGRLAVVSGKIAKHELDAMKVRTPTALLGVRGTEFIVEAGQ